MHSAAKVVPLQAQASPGVSRVVPYAHVADVEASVRFYELLGLTRQSSHASPGGRTVWAHVTAGGIGGGAELMLAQADGPIDAGQQAVLFYMYSNDVATLRTALLKSGVRDGGSLGSEHGGGREHVPAARHDRAGVAFSVTRPFYMPAGELRVHDPDGYVLLIGQLG